MRNPLLAVLKRAEPVPRVAILTFQDLDDLAAGRVVEKKFFLIVPVTALVEPPPGADFFGATDDEKGK